MPETRMFAKHVPRSTGIERVNQQVNRPAASGSGSSAHVSAAPGAGERVHSHVMNVRNPAGAALPARGPANPQAGSGTRQDAKVQLIDRRTTAAGGGGGGFSALKPTVQLIDQIPRRDQGGQAGQGGPARSPFSIEQMNLIGSLLGQYEEGVVAVGNQKDAAMARDAINKIAAMMKNGAAPLGAPAVIAPAFDPPEVHLGPANGAGSEPGGAVSEG